MIAQELEVSLHMAFVEARQQRHEFITVEHLLMALLDNPSAAEVLRACSANLDDLRKSLVGFIKENTPTVGGADEVDTQPTLGFQRVIQRAIMHVQSTSNGKKEVTGANVLVAIFGEKDSHAVYYLQQQGVTRLDVVGARNGGRVVVDEVAQVLTQVLDVGRARAQHFGCRRIIQQGEQQVLDRNELMACLTCFHERHVQADFQFLGNHASSITHCSGCPACRAWVTTCSTLVDAMSRV